jgi:hypothetical protein
MDYHCNFAVVTDPLRNGQATNLPLVGLLWKNDFNPQSLGRDVFGANRSPVNPNATVGDRQAVGLGMPRLETASSILAATILAPSETVAGSIA